MPQHTDAMFSAEMDKLIVGIRYLRDLPIDWLRQTLERAQTEGPVIYGEKWSSESTKIEGLLTLTKAVDELVKTTDQAFLTLAAMATPTMPPAADVTM